MISKFAAQNNIEGLKIIIASFIMGRIAYGSYTYFSIIVSNNLTLLYSIVTGAFVYFVAIYFMRVKEMDSIVFAIKRRMSRE